MSRSRALALAALLAAAAIVLVTLARRAPSTSTPEPGGRGRLVGALRAEPQSFNRLVTRDRASLVVSYLLNGRLVRLNHVSQEVEPALAESWTIGPDQRSYRLALRKGVTFSDGAPFTADDVVFTFRAIYDPKSGSPLADVFSVEGQPYDVRAEDPQTVVITLPAPFAPTLRLLSSLPIMPAHKLQPALDAGRLRDAWNVSTAPAEIAGLGPFVLQRYAAGERIEFARNPRYWRVPPGGAAGDLPRLERLTLRILPDQQAELLALEAGEIDLQHGEVRAEDLAAVQRLAQNGRAQVAELGVALDADSLWFNLGFDAHGRPDAERPWLDVNVRRAISLAVDRQEFVDTVMLGAGTPLAGPVTPGNRAWFDATLPPVPHDLPRARALLAAAGLTDRDGDGLLDTRTGRPARVELLTQRGHAMRERGASVIREDLRALGLDVSVATFDAGTLGERLTKGDYDATYFGFTTSDPDPSTNLDYWLSSGSFHVWHPAQKTPATAWEREIRRPDAGGHGADRSGVPQGALRSGAARLRRAPARDLFRRAAGDGRHEPARGGRRARRHLPLRALGG